MCYTWRSCSVYNHTKSADTASSILWSEYLSVTCQQIAGVWLVGLSDGVASRSTTEDSNTVRPSKELVELINHWSAAAALKLWNSAWVAVCQFRWLTAVLGLSHWLSWSGVVIVYIQMDGQTANIQQVLGASAFPASTESVVGLGWLYCAACGRLWRAIATTDTSS